MIDYDYSRQRENRWKLLLAEEHNHLKQTIAQFAWRKEIENKRFRARRGELQNKNSWGSTRKNEARQFGWWGKKLVKNYTIKKKVGDRR